MKKKYIKPVTVVIVTSPGQLLSGSPTKNTGMHHGNSKENTSFGDESDDSESAPTTGWAKVGTAWDDEL
jgi:hypothetical protein